MLISAIAQEIHEELDSPTVPNVTSIGTWLTNNIGGLNSSIKEDYSIVGGAIENFSEEAKFIFKEMYFCNYYQKKASQSLGANNYDWIEISEGDSTIRRASATSQAQTWNKLKSDCLLNFHSLCNLFKLNKVKPVGLAAFHNLLRYRREST